jgi:hypothetical protein
VTAATKANYSLREIPSGIWALGFVSMLTDVSSEMIHAPLPVYLVTVLGTSMVTVGVINGIAEATASNYQNLLGRTLGRCRPKGNLLRRGLLRVPRFCRSPRCTWTNWTGDC